MYGILVLCLIDLSYVCTWCQVLGARYLVPSTWYRVLGTRYLVPGTVLGIQNLAPGVPGTRLRPRIFPGNFFTRVSETSISMFPAMAETWNPHLQAPTQKHIPVFFCSWRVNKVGTGQKRMGTARKKLGTTRKRACQKTSWERHYRHR